MKRIVSVFLIVAMLLCIAGCGKSKPSGRYNIDSMESEGMTLTGDQLKALGMEMYIVFHDDGTGELAFGSGDEVEIEDFSWQGNQIISDDGETMEFTFDGTTVALSENGETMTFK